MVCQRCTKKWKMSNKSIVITEKQLVEAVDEMCMESLDAKDGEAWERVVTALIKARPGLASYIPEILPVTVLITPNSGQVGIPQKDE